MRGAIIAVGSELLGSERLDTNSLHLTALLRRYGVVLERKAVVEDSIDGIAHELRRLVGRYELILITGGLGPTADDLTREAVAELLGRSMSVSQEQLAAISARFERFNIPMPDVNRKQAEVPDGATLLENPRGTAPGLRLEADGSTLFLFPGVPVELVGLAASALEPWLQHHRGEAGVESASLKVACLPESTVEERILPAYEEFGRAGISVLPNPGEVTVTVTESGAPRMRRARLDTKLDRLSALIGDAVFARGEDATLESVVGALLIERGETVATAESCTGGMVGTRLTAVAGSSRYYRAGVVSYSYAAKRDQLGVSQELLEAHGAVSAEVVSAMARGGRERLAADYALAVSGVAGPGGGTADKPVGTVHVAVAGPGDGDLVHRQLFLPGDRERIRRQSSQWVLDLLRRRLMLLAGEEDTAPFARAAQA